MNLKITACWVLVSFGIQVCLCNNKLISNTDKGGIYSSKNGDITVSVSNGILTGVYEYYDKWDVKLRAFTDINVFYIYGTSTDNIHFDIHTGWPDIKDLTTGEITFSRNHDNLTIVLSKEPEEYDSFDFTKNTKENIFPLKKVVNFKEVRIVKSTKAILYNSIDARLSPMKSYLVKNDLVLIVYRKNEYSNILYRSPTAKKFSNYWLTDIDLYKSN